MHSNFAIQTQKELRGPDTLRYKTLHYELKESQLSVSIQENIIEAKFFLLRILSHIVTLQEMPKPDSLIKFANSLSLKARSKTWKSDEARQGP